MAADSEAYAVEGLALAIMKFSDGCYVEVMELRAITEVTRATKVDFLLS